MNHWVGTRSTASAIATLNAVQRVPAESSTSLGRPRRPSFAFSDAVKRVPTTLLEASLPDSRKNPRVNNL